MRPFSYRLPLSLFPVLTTLALSPCASAGSGASATTSSDHSVESLDVIIKAEPGKLDIKPAKAEVSGGYMKHADGGEGGTVKVEASKKYVVGTEILSPGGGAFMLFEPSIKGRIDYVSSSGKPNKVEGEAGGIAFGYGLSYGLHPSEMEQQMFTENQKWFAANKEQIDKLQSDAYQASKCVTSHADDACKKWGGDENKAYAAYKANTEAIKVLDAEANARKVALAAQGYDFIYSSSTIKPKHNEPHATVDFKLFKATGVYRKDNDLGYTQYGANLSLGETSFHAAGKLNGVTFDICGKIAPISGVVGKSTGTTIYSSSAAICTGIKLGKVGHLQNETAVKHDWDKYWQVSTTTSLKHIGDSPVGLYHSYEYEQSESAKLNRNTAGMIIAY